MKSSSRFFFTLLASVTLLSTGLFYPESTLGRHSNPTAQEAQAGPSVSSSLYKIVESFRKIIILLDDEASLSQEQRARCVDAGRKIHQEKQNLLDDLTASLTADLHRAGESRFRERAEMVESFIG